MFCPNLSDPKVKQQFEALQSVAPELAYYLWDKYEGEVPQKYYNLYQLQPKTDVDKNVEELDSYLIDFISKFGFKAEELDTLKDRIGVDAIGVTDVINKLILFAKDRNITTLPEEVAHAAVMLMGPSHPAIFELMGNIQSWEKYESIKKQYLPIYQNELQVEIEAVGQLISEAIVSNYEVVGIKPNILKRAIEQIRAFINNLFSNPKTQSEFDKIKKVADKVALNILKGNYNYISSAVPSGVKLDYNLAVSQNPLAQQIIETFNSVGNALTGSLALAAQGETVYRDPNELIHDLDFVVHNSFEYRKTKDLVEQMGGVPIHFGWQDIGDSKITYTFIIPAPGFKITNVTREWSGRNYIKDFDLVDSKGNIVEVTPTNAMVVDFFVYKYLPNPGLKFAPFQDIYAGKLSLSTFGTNERFFQRSKDQKDYILSQPQTYRQSSQAFNYYQLPKEFKLPNYRVDTTLMNKDGSKRLAQSGRGGIVLNPVKSIQEFYDYFTGKEGGLTSAQKAKVLENLSRNGYPLSRIQSILNSIDKINAFLVLHEQDHLDNNDIDVYWNSGRDLLTQDKIDIETRATITALKQLEVVLKNPSPLNQTNVTTTRVSINELLNRYMRQERTQDFVKSVRNNSQYLNAPSSLKQLEFIASKMWTEMDSYLTGLASVTKRGDRYYMHTSQKVKTTKQVLPVAESIAKSLNSRYLGLTKKVVNYYSDETGVYLVFSKNPAAYESMYDLIEELQEEEIRAETEMLDRIEFMRAEKQALLEKQIEANEFITEEGEVLPYNGEMFSRNFELAKQLTRKEIKQYERLFNRLAAKFPGVEWAWDTTIPQAGKIDFNSGMVLINPMYMNPELAFHEFGHILIRSIKQTNPQLFEALKAEVMALHEMSPETSSVAFVTDLYPDLLGTQEFWEEVITTELGKQAAMEEKPSLFQRILNWFKSIFTQERFIPNENTTLGDLVKVMVGDEILVDVYELSPETQDYMERRVINQDTIDQMLQYVKTDPNAPAEFQTYKEQLAIITQAIKESEIIKILDTNKFIGTGNESLNQALRGISRIKDLVTEEDIAASVLDLADYLQFSTFYLQGLAKHINNLRDLVEEKKKNAVTKEQKEEASKLQSKLLGDLHRAHKQAIAFEKHTQKIQALFTKRLTDIISTAKVETPEINKNHFLKNLFWIKNSITSIKEIYQQNLVDPVIATLGDSLELQAQEIAKSFDDQIANLKKKKQTDAVKAKIKELELRKSREVPTPENLKQMLSDPTSPWYLTFDSPMYTKTPSVQLIAGYIKDINNEFLRNLQGVSSEWQTLMDEVMQVEGGFTGSVIDVKNFYSPYYRETVLVKIIDGKEVKQPILALNTPVMTVEIKNRITELNHAIDTAETEEEALKYEEDLKKFYEQYTERPFTDEYYEIQKLLPDDIRKERNRIFDEIAAIREEFGMGDINDQVLEKLKMAEKELYDMERFYDDLGRRKTGDELATAEAIQAWKAAKKNAATIQYELTDDATILFEKTLIQKKDALNKALAKAKTPQEREEAQKQFDTWASIYTRTIFTDEFYLERQAITDEIQELLSSRDDAPLTERYENLFNLLRGNKDHNGEYLPTSLTREQTQTARNIELEIEAVKALMKENSPLDRETKKKLGVLIQKLQELQSSVNSRYYEEAVDSLKAEIRSRVTLENPTLDERSIEAIVHRDFMASDWYKENHITKNRWDQDLEQVVEVDEPIFMWRVTRPNRPEHIQSEAPSFLWYKTKVADEYRNPLYKPGEVSFKPVPPGDLYYNSNFDKLRPEQKKIMMKMRDLHYKSQENLYQSDKLGDMVPGLYKSNTEILLDTFNKNPLKRWFQQVKSWFQGEREGFEETEDLTGNPNQTDAFGDPVVKNSRRLFNRYARTIDRDKQSYNLMEAMASYATSSERFRVMRKYQTTILALEEATSLIQYKQTPQDQEKSRALEVPKYKQKTLGDLIDRELYGKYANYNKYGNILRATTKLAGLKTLGLNILSLPQNWISGLLSIYAQSGFYGIRKRDLLKAQVGTFGIAKDFYMHYNKFGNKPLSLALVDYFAGTQNQSNQASEIDNRGITKYGKVWKAVHTMRDYTEFDIASTTTYAFLEKYKAKLKDSDRWIPLKDAFIMKDNLVQIRPDVDLSEDFIALIRNRIQLANERAQGNYAEIAQPVISANAFYKLALFLKKWVVPQYKSTWGSETIHYHSGIRTIGSHRAALNFVKESVLDPSNIMNNWKYASDFEKAGLKQFMFQYATYTVFANMLMNLSLRMKCEEDGVADWKDYVCLGMKRTANEAEGVFTLWGLGELYFTYAKEQANGVSAFEKVGWQMLGPISVYRKFFTDEKLWTEDPYYKYRPNSTKIDWDATHPLLAGKSGFAVLGLEAIGAKGIAIGPKSIEYQNRAFNDYSPKTYTKELVTRYTKQHESLEVMPTRTPQAQLRKEYKKELKDIQKKILAYKQSGQPVPDDVYEELAELQRNYPKAVSEFVKSGNSEPGVSLTIPVPFFPSRKGLDMSPGEISQMNLPTEEPINPE